MKLDAAQAAHPQKREAVLMLQASELALDGRALAVQIAPESAKRQSPDYDIVARVAMSLPHAKTLLPILAQQIANYEQKVGPITAPGFDDFASQ